MHQTEREFRRPARWAGIGLMAVVGLAATTGLALAPAASATTANATTANARSAVPRVITDCVTFSGNTYSREAYCSGAAPSQFRIWILCNDGTRVQGPWRTAGAGVPSYAACDSTRASVSISGVDTEN